MPARKCLGIVIPGDLGGGFLLSDFRAEIDPEFDRRFPCFRIGPGAKYRPGPDINFQKIGERYDFPQKFMICGLFYEPLEPE